MKLYYEEIRHNRDYDLVEDLLIWFLVDFFRFDKHCTKESISNSTHLILKIKVLINQYTLQVHLNYPNSQIIHRTFDLWRCKIRYCNEIPQDRRRLVCRSNNLVRHYHPNNLVFRCTLGLDPNRKYFLHIGS